MIKQKRVLWGLLMAVWVAMSPNTGFSDQEQRLFLQPFNVDLSNKAALQRGLRTYLDHCSGCHGLKYVRYKDMARDLGIVDEKGVLLDQVIQQNLIFVGDKITDPISVSMDAVAAEKWFGVAPPDLSLVARSRGTTWLYHYLLSFYKDPSRPWGVNNAVFPSVSMPHVLENLQGLQTAVVENGTVRALKLEKPGLLKPQEYRQTISDLVNFLGYVGEPALMYRKYLGVWVLLFLGVFIVFAVLLKKEYWKDVQ